MPGLDLFLHALRMVLGNMAMTLRVGGVLLAVLIVLLQLIGPAYFAPPLTSGMEMGSGSAAMFVLSVLRIILGLWVAVAWHRYILLEENPGAYAPQWNGAAIWAYFKAGFVLALILLVAIIPMMAIGAFVLFPLLGVGVGSGLVTGLVAFLIIYLPAAYIAYRLSPILPSAAVGTRMQLRDAWYATGTSGAAFVVLTIVSLLAAWAINLPGVYLAQIATPLGLLWVAVAEWLSLMVGASILTTIYGHYVQKRSLNA